MENLELPKPKFPSMTSLKLSPPKFRWGKVLALFLLTIWAFIFGGIGGLISGIYFYPKIQTFLGKKENKIIPVLTPPKNQTPKNSTYTPQTTQEKAVIKAVKEVSPAVVSIVITKELPVYEEKYISPFEDSPFEEFFNDPFFRFKIPYYEKKGTQKKKIGGGTGFIISEDGLILTNKHVVADKEAEYTVITNEGERFPVRVIARDPIKDLAILKIEQKGKKAKFPTVKLGNSDKLEIGQTVIAIGYMLGEFQNSVSVGVISGLGRTITASGGGMVETLEDVIQTDAAINKGNSGGPLVNLKGEVIGINTAMVVGGENIGFALPINSVKKTIEQVKKKGKIGYPFLGVRYVLITKKIQKENNLPVDYGAWIVRGARGEPAIFPNSPADKVGLRAGDIILELNGEKITPERKLAKIIMKYSPGDKITLKILRGEEEKEIKVTLGERPVD